MKSFFKYIYILIGVCIFSTHLQAQGVSTLYFLENAPMRHTINPAFQPYSNVYVALPAMGYTSLGIGNNALTMKDLIFQDPTTGKTITALHPNAEGILWNKLPENLKISSDVHVNLLSFGARTGKGEGYFHFNILEHIDLGASVPKTTFGPLLGQSLNDINLNTLNLSASVYTEIAFGYSHQINEKWTIGAKLKVLLGHAHFNGYFEELNMKSNQEATRLYGDGIFQAGGILNSKLINDFVNGNGLPENYLQGQLIEDLKRLNWGGAIDLGLTYKPIQNIQIAASVTDLGIIHWSNGEQAKMAMDTTFSGLGDLKYENYTDQNGNFQSDVFLQDAGDKLLSYLDAMHIHAPEDKAFNQMLTAKINVGVDANVWKNRIGIGVYSRTLIHAKQVSEEVTFGAAFRPFRCLNIAASYSLLNGHSSNLGAAVSIAPYDGIMLTVASDYIPTAFATYETEEKILQLPYETGFVNLTFGVTIVVGTSKKKGQE